MKLINPGFPRLRRLAKIDPPFHEAGRAIQGMPLTHLRIVREYVQAFLASVSMEEKWRHDEASHPASARAERFVARLKRRMIEHERPPSENKHDYPIHNGVIILESDLDELEHPKKVVGAVSERDVGAAYEECIGAASGEDVEEDFEVDVGTAFKEDVEATPRENTETAAKKIVEAASEREVEVASREDVGAPCEKDVEASFNEYSREGVADPCVNAD